MGELDYHKQAFGKIGWFIPPYVPMGFLNHLAQEINKELICENSIEKWLGLIYSPKNMAAMVSERYCQVPFLKKYNTIISESVCAHFLGLDHVAVSGLIPVVEGVIISMAKELNINTKTPTLMDIFLKVTEHYATLNIGETKEKLSMKSSFDEFCKNSFYTRSEKYPFKDNTNRHGILHGSFSDSDYGSPLNFYKVIGAVNYLCFISSLNSNVSLFSPEITKKAKRFEVYYNRCINLRREII
jgi:hypothetical protein